MVKRYGARNSGQVYLNHGTSESDAHPPLIGYSTSRVSPHITSCLHGTRINHHGSAQRGPRAQGETFQAKGKRQLTTWPVGEDAACRDEQR